MTLRALGFSEARTRILAATHPLAPVSIALGEASGRALRGTVRAPHALPPFDNSAMDGYAVRSADLARASEAAPVELPVRDVIPAGHPPAGPLPRGAAARIMTGAMLPAGADAIVPFEDCERSGEGPSERVRFRAPAAAGVHVRRAGEDLDAGATALEAGRELSPYDVALLAALGVTRIAAGPRPRASVVSTGDELLDPGEPLRPGAIRDSNALMLGELLTEAGCEVVSIARAEDDPGAVTRHVHEALEQSDVVLTIGGVSAGDFDPVKEALGGIAGAELWRVAMKPGRPQAFGAERGLFFGLPGNPASVACVFETLVRPALRRLQGFATIDRPRIRVRMSRPIESRRGRTDFVRGRLAWRDGAWWAEPAGAQVSGHLTPQSRAHALIVVPEHVEALATSDVTPALLLRWPTPAGDAH